MHRIDVGVRPICIDQVAPVREELRELVDGERPSMLDQHRFVRKERLLGPLVDAVREEADLRPTELLHCGASARQATELLCDSHSLARLLTADVRLARESRGCRHRSVVRPRLGAVPLGEHGSAFRIQAPLADLDLPQRSGEIEAVGHDEHVFDTVPHRTTVQPDSPRFS